MPDEQHMVCALYKERDLADRAAEKLTKESIDAQVTTPGEHYHGIAPGSWEVRVPAGQVSRARVILNQGLGG